MSNVRIPKILTCFNYLVSRLWLVYIILSVLFGISLLASICQKDLAWLSAFGGGMTIFGVLLTVSHSVPTTESDITRYVETRFPQSRDGINPEYVTEQQSNDLRDQRYSEASRVLKCEAIGLTITISGTLIWAYISFLNRVFWPIA